MLGGIALFRLGDEGGEALGVQMRHRLVRGHVAHHDLRSGMAFTEGGDELLGELAGLAVAVVDTGVDLQQGGHGHFPWVWLNDRVAI